MKAIIDESLNYKLVPFEPGDPAPDGYIAWHEWALVQDRAGLRQSRCKGCGRWLFPQEFKGHKCGGK